MTGLSRTVAEGSAGDVVSELRRRYDQLTDSQKRIAETIVDDPQFVAFATVDKFAGRLNVSPSTIVRFAYRLGLSGYPELQQQVRVLVLDSINTPVSTGDDPTSHLGDSVFAQSLTHDMELLRRTATRLQSADLERAVAFLFDAERVRIVGGVTAYSAAYYSAVTLERMRNRVVLLDGGPAFTGALLEMEPGDALLAFCFAPYTKSTLDVINAAKKRGASIIAISDSPISPISRQVDVLLPAAVSGVSTQNSLVAAFAVANALLNCIAARAPAALERYGETIKLLDEWDTYLLESGGADDRDRRP